MLLGQGRLVGFDVDMPLVERIRKVYDQLWNACCYFMGEWCDEEP